jgi:hypothetical protein
MMACMQAARNDRERWEQMMRSVGSSQAVLALKDSLSGDKALSFGAEAGHFLPYHFVDFWINLALCHALLVDSSDGRSVYTVPFLNCSHCSFRV